MQVYEASRAQFMLCMASTSLGRLSPWWRQLMQIVRPPELGLKLQF